MHVLVTADTIGGVWTYTKELVTGLVRRGVHVTLVSFGDIPTAAQTDWIEVLQNVDFRPTAFRLEWMQEAEQDIDSSREFLLSVIRETKPDVLHFNQFCYGSLNVDLPKVVVAHSDVLSWWRSVKNEIPGDIPWLRWYRCAVLDGLRGATTVIAPSRWMLRQIEMLYGSPAQSAVIHNGRTPTQFNPHISKDDYVLSVGRIWDAGKQVGLLAEVESASPIFVVGAEQHADQSSRTIRSFPASGKVCVKGTQSEAQLRHWYSRASIYAATSRYEPFGLAPLEAAFSRCALLANDIPSFREIWGDTACYFQANDASSLQQQIERLRVDRMLRMTYANLAYNRARERYTADRMVDEYMRLYQAKMSAGALAA